MVILIRAALMGVRTSLVNTARGLAKSMGERLPKCDADQMGVLQAVSLNGNVQQVGGVGPMIALTFVLTIEDKDRFQRSRGIVLNMAASAPRKEPS